jgi:predicted CoA-binding protein
LLKDFKSIAIIGAVDNRRRESNKAVRAYSGKGYVVYPVSIRNEVIEGLRAYRSILDVPGEIDAASLYVNPRVGTQILEDIARKGVKLLFVNPGAESDELVDRAEELGLEPILACSIRAIGEDPDTL